MEMEWNSNGNIPVTKSIRLCIGNGNGVDKKKDSKFEGKRTESCELSQEATSRKKISHNNVMSARQSRSV